MSRHRGETLIHQEEKSEIQTHLHQDDQESRLKDVGEAQTTRHLERTTSIPSGGCIEKIPQMPLRQEGLASRPRSSESDATPAIILRHVVQESDQEVRRDKDDPDGRRRSNANLKARGEVGRTRRRDRRA